MSVSDALSRRSALNGVFAGLPAAGAGTAYAADVPETPNVCFGIIALNDCAPIVLAHNLGCFKKFLWLLNRNGQAIKLGRYLTVPLPHPSDRSMATEDPAYFQLRREVIGFLVSHTRQSATL